MAALGNESIEAVIVGGIGKRAIEGLNAIGYSWDSSREYSGFAT
ncbi:MAG: hypothetical protein QME49_09105 [bacterium]|nr:hypothetical protein [bacterium]